LHLETANVGESIGNGDGTSSGHGGRLEWPAAKALEDHYF
jgi:hypothetical protein